MSDDTHLEYNLPQDAYVNFDATSLKSFMIKKLNEGSVFVDQNYEGSNMSALLDILAFYTHVLLFYCNQSGSEALFNQASIYENMNRIVGLIGYKPTGKQTSALSINCVADATLPKGNYLLRRYSYFLSDNVQYTLLDDVPFEKVTDGEETIDTIASNVVLYQGTINEYPIYTSEGVNFETFPVIVDNLVDTSYSKFISHGTLKVFVKEVATGSWAEYTEIDSLYLSNSYDKVFDLRLNENGHYQLKFGNNTYGKRLDAGDQVSVIYLLSDGLAGSISKNVINGNKLFTYNSILFNQIYADIATDTSSQIVSLANNSSLLFTNTTNSSPIHDAETVDEIRENAPLLGNAQLRLVTTRDYEKYLAKSIPNILNSVKVVSNKEYISEYIQYFYNICVDPNKVNRVILNQVNFSDSCDFNNVNIFAVPHFNLKLDEEYPEYLSNSFKKLILDLTQDKKILTTEVIPRDPVYTAFDIGFSNTSQSKSIFSDTVLYITRDKNNKINKNTIKQRVVDAILKFFTPTHNELGQKIDILSLSTDILSIEGVKSIKTTNKKENVSHYGVSFVTWNPMFEGVDEQIVTQTITLPFFKFPYLYRPNSIINRIEVVDE